MKLQTDPKISTTAECSHCSEVCRSRTYCPLPPSPPHLCIPDVHAFVKGAAGQMPTVRTESHAVDRLLVFGQRVDTDAPLHVPETDRGVERCTVEEETATRVVRKV